MAAILKVGQTKFSIIPSYSVENSDLNSASKLLDTTCGIHFRGVFVFSKSSIFDYFYKKRLSLGGYNFGLEWSIKDFKPTIQV